MFTPNQQAIAKLVLAAVGPQGFALAGGGALIAHGLVDRETHDLDIFGDSRSAVQIMDVVETIKNAAVAAGHNVEITRSDATFGALVIDNEVQLDVGTDWREHAPVTGPFGAMLDVRDAVGNKIATAFSRGAERDIVDYFAIVASQRWTETELHQMARDRDAGFDLPILQQNIQRYLKTAQLRRPSSATPGAGVWVRPHMRGGRFIQGHWRRRKG